MKNTVSVVLTTYNGVKFLKEQMDSIKNQTMKADEVIIMDDCSNDNTVELIQDYIAFNHLSSWRLIVNEENQGWKKNFKNGFDLARGDLIFPADQDDIWHLDKIEKMTRIMEDNQDILLLTSNYHFFITGSDDGQNAYDQKMLNDGSVGKIQISLQWCYIARPGCTYCFRKNFFDEIASRWDTKYAHDAFLWRFACMKGGLYLLGEELIDFRRHGDNTTSVIKWTKQNRIAAIEDYIWFNEIALQFCSETECLLLQQIINFQKLRMKFLKEHNIIKWLILLAKYKKFYYTNKGVFADLLVALK